MTLDEITAAAHKAALEIFGIAREGDEPIVLFGPREPGFWATFTASEEYQDAKPDPLDRWSTRVISDLAQRFGGRAVFPFGGPPYAPFQRWAVESGRAWISPVGFLVHDRAGLWVSFRGAIALPFDLSDSTIGQRPCETCADKPCLTACPVSALTDTGYDLAACHSYLDGPGRADCMEKGCQVRRSCPAGAEYGRLDAQSAFHMRQFHK